MSRPRITFHRIVHFIVPMSSVLAKFQWNSIFHSSSSLIVGILLVHFSGLWELDEYPSELDWYFDTNWVETKDWTLSIFQKARKAFVNQLAQSRTLFYLTIYICILVAILVFTGEPAAETSINLNSLLVGNGVSGSMSRYLPAIHLYWAEAIQRRLSEQKFSTFKSIAAATLVTAGVATVMEPNATFFTTSPTAYRCPTDPSLYRHYLCHLLKIPPGDVIDLTGCVDRDQFIAAGGSGEIWKGMWIGTDRYLLRDLGALPVVALKVIRLLPLKEREKDKRFVKMKRELQLWSRLDHDNILPLVGIARLHGDANIPALISPWMENGNIMDFLRHNTSFPASQLLKDIIKGLHYLHTFDPEIIHGDIKGANILINHRKEAYLCDFGLSRFVVDNTLWRTTATQANGTLRWMSPELLEGDEMVPTKASDIYAYGMTCYEILSGRVPFESVSNDAAVLLKISDGQRPERVDSCHYDAIWPIIVRCWAQKAETRPTTGVVLSLVMQHDVPSCPEAPEGVQASSSPLSLPPLVRYGGGGGGGYDSGSEAIVGEGETEDGYSGEEEGYGVSDSSDSPNSDRGENEEGHNRGLDGGDRNTHDMDDTNLGMDDEGGHDGSDGSDGSGGERDMEPVGPSYEDDGPAPEDDFGGWDSGGGDDGGWDDGGDGYDD